MILSNLRPPRAPRCIFVEFTIERELFKSKIPDWFKSC